MTGNAAQELKCPEFIRRIVIFWQNDGGQNDKRTAIGQTPPPHQFASTIILPTIILPTIILPNIILPNIILPNIILPNMILPNITSAQHHSAQHHPAGSRIRLGQNS